MKNNKKGFSLFELLVTISIIGILTAIASVSFSSAQKKARDARRLEDISNVAKAAETYYSLSNYVYPLNTASASWVIASTGEAVLSVFPSDPKGPTYTAYSYSAPGQASFCSCALVENTNNANSGANCNFSAASKTYFCLKNQQ